MKERSIFKNFIGKYTLSKTLRFELIPIGETINNLGKNHDLLSKDEERAKSYPRVKELLDEIHKKFITESLREFNFKDPLKDPSELKNPLEKYYSLYSNNKTSEEKEELKKLENLMREEIINYMKKYNENNEDSSELKYYNLFKKEMIECYAEKIIQQNPKFKGYQKDVEIFRKFSTYFIGFHENRKNIYLSAGETTSLATRIVNENLPKYINNIKVLKEIKEKYPALYKEISELSKEMEVLNNFNKSINEFGYIDKYNYWIGGYCIDGNSKKERGINEIINLYSQKNKLKIPKLTLLFKQILSDREKISFIPEQFIEDESVICAINDFLREFKENVLNDSEDNKENKNLEFFLNDFSNYELSKIYIKNGAPLTNISKKIFGEWNFINKILEENYDKNKSKSASHTKTYLEKREKELKEKICSIQELNELIESKQSKKIEDYFKNIKGESEKSEDNIFKLLKMAYHKYNEYYIKNEDADKLLGHEPYIENVKAIFDLVKNLQWNLKYIYDTNKESDKDLIFYEKLEIFYNEVKKVEKLYDKVRNYVTKKPYSSEKYKLNFSRPTLLDGWSKSKEQDNLNVLLRKGEKYFLGIMDAKNNSLFKNEKKCTSEEECYEKMEYNLIAGAAKSLSKKFFAKNYSHKKIITDEIKNIKEKELYKNKDDKTSLHRYIDFLKEAIKLEKDYDVFNFKFRKTEEYEGINDFYNEVDEQSYKISFVNIPENYINKAVEEGKLYLFQIYNKDFSENKKSKGTPNLHTIYWKALFDKDNLNSRIFKLNGQAEIFYRKSSIPKEQKVIHIAKNINDPKTKGKFDYDIIKDRRFTMDKFQFHVSININNNAGKIYKFNEIVNKELKSFQNVNVIGIDRGERHLLYLTLIDKNGNILKQKSYNTIETSVGEVNYNEKLTIKSKGKLENKKNWRTEGTIKELKEGYLSQVIHEISKMMVENNAIVALEDLNFGFKRGRFHVEKQVYQKFEKMLIDKLNYLVFKNNNEKLGGDVLNGYQLTDKFTAFKDLGKQTGFLYYVPAGYTSKIDPKTGFVDLLYPKYESEEKAKEFFSKFNNISYNSNEGYFEFETGYSNFMKKEINSKTDWTICTNSTRIRTFRNSEKNNQWDNEEINLSEKFKELFAKNNIDYEKENLKEEILKHAGKDFYETLIYYLKLTLQMRNSKIGTDVDYLISPIKNKNGEFFDTRLQSKDENGKLKEENTFPNNADANGAYNIALKGLILLDKIRKTNENEKYDLKISNEEYFEFIQKRADK